MPSLARRAKGREGEGKSQLHSSALKDAGWRGLTRGKDGMGAREREKEADPTSFRCVQASEASSSELPQQFFDWSLRREMGRESERVYTTHDHK